MVNVWTYWKCSCCNNIIRGDCRECPSCGKPIPSNVKYMMPDNLEVILAHKNGNVLTSTSRVDKCIKQVDERGIVSEIVPNEYISTNPNWNCLYCGSQNKYEDIICQSCGSTKKEALTDYFETKITEKSESNTYQQFIKSIEEPTIAPMREIKEEVPFPNLFDFCKPLLSVFRNRLTWIIGGSVLLLIFLIWLFTPITRESKIESFRWQRSIAVEEYTLCHENDWSVPTGGRITSQRSEIHHYDKVLDHYETKTKQVSERVIDHYDTIYKDLGNGQAKMEKKPVYKTVYHTETYQEPVYRKEPVYRTKYYYDIDRWKEVSYLTTSGGDQKPYWKETSIPSSVSNPKYGDKKLGSRKEEYEAIVKDNKGNYQSINYSYSEWLKLEIGQTIKYKTFRFSQKPLYGKNLEIFLSFFVKL